MIKRIFIFLGILPLLFMLTGCYHIERIVTLKSDGSGTVEEVFTVNRKAYDKIISALQELPKKDNTDVTDLFSKSNLEKSASSMGEGVRCVESNKILTENSIGYRAIFAFQDINKIKISPDSVGDTDTNKIKKYVFFKFKKGSDATLTVKLPDELSIITKLAIEATKAKQDVKQDKRELSNKDTIQFLKNVGEMHSSMIIVTDGKTIKSNATNMDNNTITLYELNILKLIEYVNSQPHFEIFNGKNLPGFKCDMNEELVVSFGNGPKSYN